MTKTATDVRRYVAPALGAGAALSAMTFASRLPVTLDFILPRRAGWGLFVAGYETLSRPGPRLAFTTLVTALLFGSLARFGWLAAAKKRTWSGRDFVTRGIYLALVVLLLRWSGAVWFEVSQKVWFPYGSMNVWEPLSNLLVLSGFAFLAMTRAGALLAATPAPLRALLPWTVVNAFLAFAAFNAYGAWRPAVEPDGVRRLFVVLTEEEGRPGQMAYDLPLSDGGREEAGVRRLESLRAMYETRAKLMDVEGLREALLLGVVAGDDLARALLLDNLSAAAPTPEALVALKALANEETHRIGQVGASRIALTYAHLGAKELADKWAEKAATGPRGIPAGLLSLNEGGALKPGRISGRVDGLKPLKIALYRKSDPAAPYLLDAAALVAAVTPDAKGGFAFTGLASGRYYLALAFSEADAAQGEIRAFGHRGDLMLDARKPALDLPPLSLKLK